MDRLELALELDLGGNSRGCLRRGWTGWKRLWIWEGILEALRRGWADWNWLCSWIWGGILEAACEEDGQAGTGSGAGSGKEFSKLPAKRMDRLERPRELDLGRNSRGCLLRG
jgi:hypothetical protein